MRDLIGSRLINIAKQIVETDIIQKEIHAVIIGDEILSGKTLETNSNFICKEFFKIGVVCEEIRVIKDLKVRIIEVVKEFRNKSIIVISHDRSIMSRCDTILNIDSGHLTLSKN